MLAAEGLPQAVYSRPVREPRTGMLTSGRFSTTTLVFEVVCEAGDDSSGGGEFTAPMSNVFTRPQALRLFSDASKQAIGRLCVETRQYWRYDLSDEERSRFVGSSKAVVGVNDKDKTVYVLELICMLVGAWLLVV